MAKIAIERTPITARVQQHGWSERAERIIREALRYVPPMTSEKEIRQILKPLYPFGHRVNWPYKAWCRQVRLALQRRNLLKGEEPPAPRLRIVRFTVVVECGYCQMSRSECRGCLICRSLIAEADNLNADTAIRGGLQLAHDGDQVIKGQLMDYLHGLGYPMLAEQLEHDDPA